MRYKHISVDENVSCFCGFLLEFAEFKPTDSVIGYWFKLLPKTLKIFSMAFLRTSSDISQLL